ncbi:SeqA protein [Aestuariibacter sp. GS-14]|uniref:SeqA protein n=1 Tax=Aestuariibacter sp. GS-14 TaxID=2590670 RepID=UPI00112A5982|nr:SeqA protein [Aestuariibacter sp. GS-14]TPV55441.1 SeqA protein [Aestuariibacter sp. GS-14]
MKTIEIDDDLYAFIAGQTKHIGESASQILRRLLIGDEIVAADGNVVAPVESDLADATQPNAETAPTPVAVKKAPAKSTKAKVVTEIPAVVNVVTATPANADDDALLKLVNPTTLKQFDKRVDQFLYILQQAFVLQPVEFAQVESIKGKNRKYFATSKEELLATGSSTNPKAIPESGYWVVTNNNTAKKLAMLSQVLQILGYSDKVVASITEAFSEQ